MEAFRFLAVEDALTAATVRLTAAEQERRDRLRHERDRAAYVAAHTLVRICAGELLGAPAGDITVAQQCPGCGKIDHGRPYVVDAPDVHVSLSHTRGWVAAIAAERPCGIDIERVRPVSPAVVRRVLARSEQAWVAEQPDPVRAFATLWARKEALVKAGIGDLDLASRIDVLGDARLRDWAHDTGEAAGAWACLDGEQGPDRSA